MHRHVRRVGDEVAFGVEQRAGEVEPLLDVDRVGRVGERDAHLLGDRHEEIVEHLEQNRIGARADRVRAPCRFAAVEHDIGPGGVCRAPAGLDDGRRVVLADDRRTGDGVAGAQMQAIVDCRFVERAGGVDPLRPDRRQRKRARLVPRHGIAGVVRPADRLDRDRLDDERLARHQEAVLLPILALELGDDIGDVAHTRLERGVGALVLDVKRASCSRHAPRRCPAR